MNTRFKNLIKYYRNSVADGERMDITAKECENGDSFGSVFELKSVELKPLYDKLFESLKKAEKKNEDQQDELEEEKYPIDIFIAPLFLSAEHEHAVQNANKQKVYPFWMAAKITEQGFISIDKEQIKLPWFVRSVLEPVCFDANYFPVISSVDKVDESIDTSLFEVDTWEDYLKISDAFFKNVTGFDFNSFELEGFKTHLSTCIIKAKNIVSATGIIRLYDDILNDAYDKNLIKDFTKIDSNDGKSIPDKDELFLDATHFGQYNNKFSLSTSQRKSLILFERESASKTLAVNGPPGTGKTTLLQSIVANEIVKAVGELDSPPLILASSTNNQAITNILDNFGKEGGVIDRWLPNLSSLGMYMISSDRKKQKQALIKGYQLLTRSNDIFDGHYFQYFHGQDIDDLKGFYVDKFQGHFNSQISSITEILSELKGQILGIKSFVKNTFSIIIQANKTQEDYFSFELLPEKENELENIAYSIQHHENEQKAVFEARERLEDFINNNKLLYFLLFITFFRNQFYAKFRLYMADILIEGIDLNLTITAIRQQVFEIIKKNKEKVGLLKTELKFKQFRFEKVMAVKNTVMELDDTLNNYWLKYLDTLESSIKNSVEIEFKNLGRVEQINRILDVSFRFDAFILSVHYWEGKYLHYVENNEVNINKGIASKQEQFKLMSYLTPLFISTFHSVPNYSSHWDKTSDKWIQKPIYELFDLLIVDEAGQVAPEIGTASFALAKKALVVGDIYQIEPVWNIPYPKVDEGNLKKYNVLNGYTYFDLKEKGMLCASGSLMRLAQNTSSYFTNKHLKGTLLTEHRRCVDELVQFSNDHVYDNLLDPKVGSFEGMIYGTDKQLFLPPLAYLHVNGISEKRSGSNYNIQEAAIITRWIKEYGHIILNSINVGKSIDKQKELKDIIAIVTPFAEQKNEIYRQFRKNKISNDITVGTVHALQGAERDIILFSPVYGKNHTGSLFFDMGFNMLNVAITRAKKHFIVIGNMSLFDVSKKFKPSGALASYLFNSAQNELSGSFLYDLPKLKSENRISTLEKHSRAIKQCFITARERVIIVSPFISIEALNADNIPDLIKECISKDISVTVYTDKFLDSPKGNLKVNAEKGRKTLIKSGVKLEILKGIHNKCIAVDENILIEGSFNWLSAVRDESNPYYRHEVSQIIQGEEAKIQIGQLIEELSLIER